jgi:hypothetical protein
LWLGRREQAREGDDRPENDPDYCGPTEKRDDPESLSTSPTTTPRPMASRMTHTETLSVTGKALRAKLFLGDPLEGWSAARRAI